MKDSQERRQQRGDGIPHPLSRADGDLLGHSLPEEGSVPGQALQLFQRIGQRGAEQQRLSACWDGLQNHLQVRGEVSAALLQQPVSLIQNLGMAANTELIRTHPHKATNLKSIKKKKRLGNCLTKNFSFLRLKVLELRR